MMLMAAVVLCLSAAGFGQASYDGKTRPGECPDGWRPVTPPNNPVLLCLPDTLVLATPEPLAPALPEGDCPEGWKRVTPPLNPVLSCLPGNFTFDMGREELPPGGCPEGWDPVTPPLNPVLSCLPNTLVIAPARPAPPYPGECPEGWKRVTPPLNPVLGCQPDTILSGK